MLTNQIFQYRYSQIDEHKPAEFCLQALTNSVKLDLGLGYFSSASFNVLAYGIAKFISNNGVMNLYINQYVTSEDFELLKNSQNNKFDESIALQFNQLKS